MTDKVNVPAAAAVPGVVPTDHARAQSGRFVGLDYVRGIAALLVAILHMCEFCEKHGGTAAWMAFGRQAKLVTSGWIDFGKIGIAAFFCVSGAIIPQSLPADDCGTDRRASLARFGAARFFRLYPMYWTSLVLAIVLGSAEVSGAALVVNATMLQRFVGVADALGVYWTLQIELIFYGMCAVMFWFGVLHRHAVQTRTWRIMLAMGIAMAAVRYVTGYRLPVAIFLALTLMFFSCRWRGHFLSREGEKAPPAHDYIVLLVGLFLTCRLAYSRDYGFGETWYRYFFSYIIGFFLFRSLAGMASLRAGRVFANLGQSSYALYLLHPVIGFHVLVLLRSELRDSPGLAVLSALAASIVFAQLAYELIEKRGIALGRRVTPARAAPVASTHTPR
jgi:peptidoglycan/LPS O-acetylase OafA/YrhL